MKDKQAKKEQKMVDLLTKKRRSEWEEVTAEGSHTHGSFYTGNGTGNELPFIFTGFPPSKIFIKKK